MNFAEAVETLVRSGADVQLTDIPGLLCVDGQELTMMQVISKSQQVTRGEQS